MTDLVIYSRSGPVGTIVIDDGKANVMSLAMLNALHGAFDQAEKDKAVVILKARGKHFSGGFDLSVFAKGSAEDQYLMLKAGAELALRILSFPTPVVAACQGNAYPMGAFLIMSSDHRIAAEGDYRIGMNEVAIGLTVPRFAIEIARQLRELVFTRRPAQIRQGHREISAELPENLPACTAWRRRALGVRDDVSRSARCSTDRIVASSLQADPRDAISHSFRPRRIRADKVALDHVEAGGRAGQ